MSAIKKAMPTYTICMEHCDACQYLEIEQGDMHCNYPRQKEKATN